jgi:LDH2 family malate/lactate/ureidoglycolate dehydrogenase
VEMTLDEAFPALRDMGFSERDARILADHFVDAERRGKRGHGLSRVTWLATQDVDPTARPTRLVAEEGFERWDGNGALGYLALAEICAAQVESPPAAARLIVASNCFPTGMLGYWTRQLAEAGLVAVLTATSPARLGHPGGGPKLAGTNPLAIAIPSSDGRPVVSDVSMGQVTYGDVIAGLASEEELVPFGGESAHKAFALALGLQLLVDALAGEGYGAVMVVARPEADPVPALRELAEGVRLPGDTKA